MGWLYSLLSQGAVQRWNKVGQVKINSQCQNDEIKLLIFLFCLSVTSQYSRVMEQRRIDMEVQFHFDAAVSRRWCFMFAVCW